MMPSPLSKETALARDTEDKMSYLETMCLRHPDTSILLFHANSADSVPGLGCREYRCPSDGLVHLSRIKNWRRILSDSYVYKIRGQIIPICLHGRKFASVKHYVLFRKFLLKAPDLALRFQLSGKWGRDARIATANGHGHENVRMPGWHEHQHKRHVRNAALLIKFRDFSLPRKVLELTESAVLTRLENKARGVVHVDWTLHILREYLFLDNDELNDVTYAYYPAGRA